VLREAGVKVDYDDPSSNWLPAALGQRNPDAAAWIAPPLLVADAQEHDGVER